MIGRSRQCCSRLVRRAMFCAAAFAMQAAYADCIDTAAARHGLDPDLVRAVAYFESRLNPTAINKNKNGTVDVGLMQINSVHFPRLANEGIDHRRLTNACLNADVGAAMLRDSIARYGPTWLAVGSYHSRTDGLRSAYANSVRAIYLARPWARREPLPGQAASRTGGFEVVEIEFQ